MVMVMHIVEKSLVPSVAEKYDSPEVKRLVTICRVLQETAGKRPFFLSCRVAGRLIGVHYTTAADYLYMLCHDKPPVLELAEQSNPAALRAHRYRYIGR